MTMDPGKRALVDQATASASWFIDEILAEMVTLIGRGMPHVGVIEQIGGGMAMHQLNDTQVLVVAAVATARLARLHHAIGQLADELKCDNDVGRWPALPAALIKLVDDHG